MDWSASVLTTISSDTEPTIVLTFPSAKYIFNAGENTNRAFLQSRRNWKRTRGLFFTQVGTQRAGGLPGLLMSFADATIPRLDIVGPPGLMHFLAAMRSYTFRDTMPIYPIEAPLTPDPSVNPNPVYKDDNLTLYTIPILPSPQVVPAASGASTVSTIDFQSKELLLKRKRDPSPNSPSKRTATALGEPSTALAEQSERLSLRDLMSLPGFLPETLEGGAAQEWRRLMIDTMFPGSKAPKNEKLESRKRREKKREDLLEAKGGHVTPMASETETRDIGKNARNKGRHLKQGRSEKEKGAMHEIVNDSLDKNLSLSTADEQSPVPTNEGQTPSSNIDIYKRTRIPIGFHKQLPKYASPLSATDSDTSIKPTIAYVAVGPRVRGKFDVKKAEALGVPFGPLRGRLTKGQTITFTVKEGGNMVERAVQPEECVGESESPAVVLIFDIPTREHISSLVSTFNDSPFYSKFRSKCPEDSKEYAVRAVFHICGDGVFEDERYTTFMRGFAPEAHHLVASREHGPDPVTFTSAAFNQLRLNQLDPEIFPLPKFQLTAKKDMTKIPNLPPQTCLMSANLLVNMRPPGPPIKEKFADEGDLFHPAIISPTTHALPNGTLERFTEVRANVEGHIKSGKVSKPQGGDIKILPLGTGSALPSKYRNVSATLVQIPNWGNILLDAGEGTWGQLVRQFGIDESLRGNIWEVLRDLKCIFISHIHGDHHMGIAQILAKRRLLDPPPTEPLYLVSIRAVHLYLRELSDIQDLGLHDPSGNGVLTVMSEALHWKQAGTYQTGGMWQVGGDEPWTNLQQSQLFYREMCGALGLESFSTVDVYHRTRCYGVVIKHTDGWSIVFSGDTQPTNTLVWAGQNATLLIHEATMADDQAEMAKRKAHSTFGQAVDIGRRMNAENILLTHFSARYPKMPPSGLASPAVNSQGRELVVALAFDHTNITIGDMWKLKFYMPAVEQSFKDTVEEGDDEEGDIAIVMEVDVS